MSQEPEKLIACATDRRYVEMTGVLIRSVSAQPHATPLEIIVFCLGLKRSDREKLQRCAGGGTKLTFMDIEGRVRDEIGKMPVKNHLSIAAYLSVYIPYLLRERTGRVIYIDCDIVVNASLDDLFGVDMQEKPVAAVPDTGTAGNIRKWNGAIGHDAADAYFNSGLFVVDIAEWNRREITQQGVAYAAARTGRVYQHDQAVLNRVLKDQWVPLAPEWNNKPTRLPPDEARRMPIQHFRGRVKPFHADYPAEYREIYDLHRGSTPWAAAPRMRPFMRNLLIRRRAWSERYKKMTKFLAFRGR